MTANWTVTGAAMNVNRRVLGMVALPPGCSNHGTVLCIGGLGEEGTQLPSCEIYSQISLKWTVCAPMSAGRYGHGACTLSDGRVVVIGGERSEGSPGVDKAEIYTPADDVWVLKDYIGAATIGTVLKPNHSPSLPLPFVVWHY